VNNAKFSKRLMLAGVLSLMALGADCEDPPPPPGMGAFILGARTVLPPPEERFLSGGLREALDGLEGLTATATSIRVVHRTVRDDPSTERVLELASGSQTLDLLTALEDSAPRVLAFLKVPEGYVFQVRVTVSSIVLTLDGESLEVKTPSAEQSGLKIDPDDGEPFVIRAGERTGARVLLDPFDQLVRNRGVGFLLKPVLTAEKLTAYDLLGFIADQIVVGFARGISDADIDAINAVIGATILHCWRPANYCTMRLPIDVSFRAAVEHYVHRDDVRFVLPNQRVRQLADTPPDDPEYVADRQLNLRQVSVYRDGAEAGAWDRVQGSNETAVAVIDVGVHLDHLDLIENVWINTDEVPPAVLAAVGDLDGDGENTFLDLAGTEGVLTFADLDALVPMFGDAVCPIANTFPLNRCNAGDLVDGTGDTTYGWQDGIPGAGETDDAQIDDVVGWNFEGDNNLARLLSAHPTNVASVIGVVGNNMLDIAGVAWRTRIMSVQPESLVAGAELGDLTRSSVIEAMLYATSQGADIIDMSIGYYASINTEETNFCFSYFVDVLSDFAGKFDDYREMLRREMAIVPLDGTLVVASAGNCAQNHEVSGVLHWPADVAGSNAGDFPSFIRVGGVDASDNLWFVERVIDSSDGSDFGPTFVDIAAPAVDHAVLGLGGGVDPDRAVGTSFAAPLVAGVAALVLEAEPGLRGHGCELADRILRNADEDVGDLTGRIAGGRRLNALAAVDDVRTAPVRTCP
jgi:subtilisin family serine protease